MVLAEFLQKFKPCMIRVCCYLKGDLHRNILNTKPFSRYIFGLRYWNDNFDSSSIRSLFSCVFKFKGQKNLNNENFANTSETLVTLISKWPGISKIYPPILDHRMFQVLSNNLLVFDSSRGTPCSLFYYHRLQAATAVEDTRWVKTEATKV